MSKAILILDEMPIGCLDCKLHIGITDFAGVDAGCYCLVTGITNRYGQTRGAQCPLEFMPRFLSADEDFPERDLDEIYGWNNCLKAIGGDDNAD